MLWGDVVSVNKHSMVTRALSGCVAVNRCLSVSAGPCSTLAKSLLQQRGRFIFIPLN